MTKYIQQAINLIGSQEKLAAACSVTQGAVSKWARGGNIRPEHALSVERATDGAVTASQLRPDVFGQGQAA